MPEDGSGPVASVQTVFVAPATAAVFCYREHCRVVQEEVTVSERPDRLPRLKLKLRWLQQAKSTNLEADAAPTDADAAPCRGGNAEADVSTAEEPECSALKPLPRMWHVTPRLNQSGSKLQQRSFSLMKMACGFCRTARPLRSKPAVTIDTISYSSNGDVILGGRVVKPVISFEFIWTINLLPQVKLPWMAIGL